ncbi:hypothetical protein DES53_105244 [Roseimicrobium gellanilyticum]|uniref:Uncharacterized protein n=1 Tax=Roseimicrobium gellanilyticum TaxID=748857 RepID=A0A366HPD8_9BACT|nr:hypothetical protein [Roseimicrobium gellanilyticum]RBP43845.1 hypothetical protein DES53_105244 [Roseimicrobium gellanilyticum]
MTTDEAFVAELRTAILGDMLEQYLTMVCDTDPASINDDGWRAFIGWVQESGPLGTTSARTVIRQVLCNAISKTLAVLDGSSNLATMREKIVVLYDGQEIQDNLTDNFWEQEEEEEG